MVMLLELESRLGLGSRSGQRLSQGGAGAGVASMGSTEALTDGAGHEVRSGGLYLDVEPVAVGHQQPWGGTQRRLTRAHKASERGLPGSRRAPEHLWAPWASRCPVAAVISQTGHMLAQDRAAMTLWVN